MQKDTNFSIISKDIENPTGEQPAKYQEVTIRVQKEGSALIKHSGIIGKDELSNKIQAVIVQMRKGQKWTVQDQDKVKFCIWLVELGQSVDPRTHIQKAQGLKSDGNGQIKAKQYVKAVQIYHKAYKMIVNDPSSQAQELKLSIISNMALALLNSGDYKAALQWCNIHLQESIEPNVKTIYRKASANKGLKEWQQAKNDIRFGISLCIGDDQTHKNFNNLSVQIQKEQKYQKQKEKAVYGKMFN